MKKGLHGSPESDRIAVMRLWQHKNGNWYITFRRGAHRSLDTNDPDLAKELFRKAKKKALDDKLFILEKRQLLLVEDFKKEYLSTRTGQAPNTQRLDELALNTFIEFYGNRSMAGITEPVMLKYRGHLKTLGLVNNSANAYLRHLRGAIKFALKAGYIPAVVHGRPNDPRDGMKQYHVDHSQKIYMSPEEVRHLIDTAQNYNDMKIVVPLMVYTGIPRQSVVAPLYITDAKIQYRRGKTKKLIAVPIHDDLRPYLVNLGTGICRISDLHPDTISHKFHEIVKKAEIPGGVSAHKLRHTFATLMLKSGVKIERVSKWLGHADIRITLRFYAEVVSDDDAVEINKFKL